MMRSRSDGPTGPIEVDRADHEVERSVRFLQEAVQARRSPHYSPSVAVILGAVRTILAQGDCLAKDSPTLRQYPALRSLRSVILGNLQSLVKQARKCTALAKANSPSDIELEQFVALSEIVLDDTNRYIHYREENRIQGFSTPAVKAYSNGSLQSSLSSLSPASPTSKLEKLKTKSMGDLRSRRKLAEHAEQLHQVASGEAMQRLASNASDASLWPPSLSSGASSVNSIDSPKTPEDLRSHVGTLDTYHDQLLSVIAAFIGHVHAHTRESHASSYAHLIDMACEAVELVRDIMTLVEDVARDSAGVGNPGKNLEELTQAREALYESTNALVTAVRIATDAPDPELNENEDQEKQRLLQAATRLLRSSGEGVGQVKRCMRRSEAASRVFDMVSSPDISDSKAFRFPIVPNQSKDSPINTSYLRERHTLSMLGRTADGLGHLRHQYNQRDSLNSSKSSVSSIDQHSQRSSQGSLTSQSVSVTRVEIPDFTPAPIRPLNTLSNRRGQPSPAPLQLKHDLPEKCSDTSPLPSPLQTSVRAQDIQLPDSATTVGSSEAKSPQELGSQTRTSDGQAKAAETHQRNPKDTITRGYEAREVHFNGDGHVTGGTLRCLVERMTLHDVPIDAGFSQTFFLTFRLFSTPSELTSELVTRFDLSPQSDLAEKSSELQQWQKKVAIPVRLRVVNLFKTWLESHWQPETDTPVLVPLLSFAQARVVPTMGQAGNRLIDLVHKRTTKSPTANQVKSLHKSISTDRFRQGKPAMDGVPLHSNSPITDSFSPSTFTAAPPAPLISKGLLNDLRSASHSRIPITFFDPLEIARQFTVMETRLYGQLLPQELLMQSRGAKEGKGSPASHVKQMSALSTRITGWIAEVILDEQDAKKRASVLKWFIKLADVGFIHAFEFAVYLSDACLQRCYGLQNYNTLMAILAALNSSTVARLRRTWDSLSAKYKPLLEKLRKATEHTRNYAEYRSMLRQAEAPALPFLGLFLTDLTFCYEGNPAMRASRLDPTLKLINFDRYRVSQVRSDAYEYKANVACRKWPRSSQRFNDFRRRSTCWKCRKSNLILKIV